MEKQKLTLKSTNEVKADKDYCVIDIKKETINYEKRRII